MVRVSLEVIKIYNCGDGDTVLEYTKSHCTVHFKCVDYLGVGMISIKKKNFEEILFLLHAACLLYGVPQGQSPTGTEAKRTPRPV